MHRGMRQTTSEVCVCVFAFEICLRRWPHKTTCTHHSCVSIRVICICVSLRARACVFSGALTLMSERSAAPVQPLHSCWRVGYREVTVERLLGTKLHIHTVMQRAPSALQKPRRHNKCHFLHAFPLLARPCIWYHITNTHKNFISHLAHST